MSEEENTEAKDRYVGDKDPATGLRHGTGTYYYPNKFFSYTGEWHQSKKHGEGVLNMADGGYIKAQFQDGQIEGPGERKWGDGSMYVGTFHMGEMHGKGLQTLASGEHYDGQFHLNVREGLGQLTTTDGDVITGNFMNGRPHGDEMKIEFPNSDTYDGCMTKGKIHGKGVYKYAELKATYDGEFEDGKRHREAAYFTEMDYRYEGNFVDDKPETFPTHLTFKPPEPAGEEEDPKAKKKKAEDEDEEGLLKLKYQEGKEPL